MYSLKSVSLYAKLCPSGERSQKTPASTFEDTSNMTIDLGKPDFIGD